MRVIVIPESPEVYILIGVVLVLAVAGAALYQRFFPPAAQKLLADQRYRAALSVYTDRLQMEQPTRADRQAALAAASDYLWNEGGVPAEEAGRNLLLVVAGHDRERSYDCRHDALAYEQAGAYEMALDCFETAAMWQEDHDPKDHQFLQRCLARVRKKVPQG
jgi:hypothetical protein